MYTGVVPVLRLDSKYRPELMYGIVVLHIEQPSESGPMKIRGPGRQRKEIS